jgi:hypothetical protein
VAAGCGHPLIPKSALAAPTDDVRTQPGPEFATIGASGPVLGVDLYAPNNYSAPRVEEDGERTLSYIRNVLHAAAVGIVWDFYAASPVADTVQTTSATLSAANVAILTAIAQKDHLLVEYRPLILIQDDRPWEGYITPTNPVAWFDNYYRHELPYLRVAQRYGVNEFVAATEMVGLNASPYWPSFFARLATVYHGVVSYAAHDVDYFPWGTHLLSPHLVGVDMDEGLRLPASASSAQVTSAFEAFFAGLPDSVLHRTAIDQTGIEARVGAYQMPPILNIQGTLDEAVQANWFTAACDTAMKYHLRAVFFWAVNLTDYPVTQPARSLAAFEGKEGAQAISNCASILTG